jgi:hypothetical protein
VLIREGIFFKKKKRLTNGCQFFVFEKKISDVNREENGVSRTGECGAVLCGNK